MAGALPTQMNTAMRSAWRELARVPDLVAGPSVFADDDATRAYWIGGKQIANLLDADRVEIRATKAVIRELRPRLKADPRVELRRNPSDWLTVRVGSADDVALVVELTVAAADAHRSQANAGGPPVPEGADLARRRRFH